jgi:hypothetical protein
MAGRNQAELVFQKHTFACFGIFDLQSRNSHLSSTFRRHSNDIQQITWHTGAYSAIFFRVCQASVSICPPYPLPALPHRHLAMLFAN